MHRAACAQVDFADTFKLFCTTRLPNPHFTPELSAKVTVVDFTVTMEGAPSVLQTSAAAHACARACVHAHARDAYSWSRKPPVRGHTNRCTPDARCNALPARPGRPACRCPPGLEDQLLGKLILKEKHELEEQRQQLLEEVQSYKKKIKQLEDDLLFRSGRGAGTQHARALRFCMPQLLQQPSVHARAAAFSHPPMH